MSVLKALILVHQIACVTILLAHSSVPDVWMDMIGQIVTRQPVQVLVTKV